MADNGRCLIDFQVEKGRVEYYGYRTNSAQPRVQSNPQRIAIYDALRGHHDHPTAEMLYHTLRPEHPSMSLATVYKTMEIFEKIGLVKILEVGDERAHYDWDTQAHSHIRCIRCNKVEDMMGIDLQAIKTIADQGSEYQITGQHITFEGVCPECAKKESH